MENAGKKLDWLAVEEMRAAYEKGASQGELARFYQVSVGTVGRIVRGESWQRSEAPRRVARGLPPLLSPEESLELFKKKLEELQPGSSTSLLPASPLEE